MNLKEAIENALRKISEREAWLEKIAERVDGKTPRITVRHLYKNCADICRGNVRSIRFWLRKAK